MPITSDDWFHDIGIISTSFEVSQSAAKYVSRVQVIVVRRADQSLHSHVAVVVEHSICRGEKSRDGSRWKRGTMYPETEQDRTAVASELNPLHKPVASLAGTMNLSPTIMMCTTPSNVLEIFVAQLSFCQTWCSRSPRCHGLCLRYARRQHQLV